jgi:hypothetical protein
MVGTAAAKPRAVLLVAAWHEGEPSLVAARITYTFDVRQSHRFTVTAAGVDAISAVVRRWLDDVQASRHAGDAPVTEE